MKKYIAPVAALSVLAGGGTIGWVGSGDFERARECAAPLAQQISYVSRFSTYIQEPQPDSPEFLVVATRLPGDANACYRSAIPLIGDIIDEAGIDAAFMQREAELLAAARANPQRVGNQPTRLDGDY